MADRISPVVLAALERVVSDNGWLAAARPGPLRALLSDVLGSATDQHRAELDAIVVSAEEGVPTELRTAGRGTAQSLVPGLTERLVAWGMDDGLAASVVESWASLVPEISRSAPAPGDSQTVISAVRNPAPAPAEDTPAQTPPAPEPVAAAASPVPGSPAPAPAEGQQNRRTVWVAAAVAVAVVIVAGGWLGLHARGHHQSPLLAALSSANDHYAKGLIPPSSCKSSTDHVVCTNPDSAVSMLDVRTYPDKQSMYRAYEAIVEQLRGSPLQTNKGDCNAHHRSGERSWNHAFQHPLNFSIQDHISQDLTKNDMAEGRLACEVTGGYETIVWTADAGDMLGQVQGPLMGLFPAWKLIHHGITPPGAGPAPMDDMTGGSTGAPSPSATDSMGMG
ncbi:MAG TPA: hypothetical protein VHW64_20000 [Nocardioides sp.]|jgi:hypothetical protein|uniref:hypothetical protein n=1 Tax=Nocardioides sp. TaxID=35761 RepID=UPI002E3328EF|nr:hypothetical protein [Nocardioides sp.]HEX3932980.1 hypothetical protein [Nocardioides sp.]